MISFSNILVPTDFSPGFEIAFNYAIGIAKSMKSKLHIVHVIEPAVYPTDKGFSPVAFVDLEKELEANAKTELNKIKEKLSSEGIDFKIELLYGKPSQQIIDYAEANGTELICIATHGRSGFEHLLFGSTTEKVLRKSKCPVLAVRMKCQDK